MVGTCSLFAKRLAATCTYLLESLAHCSGAQRSLTVSYKQSARKAPPSSLPCGAPFVFQSAKTSLRLEILSIDARTGTASREAVAIYIGLHKKRSEQERADQQTAEETATHAHAHPSPSVAPISSLVSGIRISISLAAVTVRAAVNVVST